MAVTSHNTPGLPDETLTELHDCLTLALDVSEKDSGQYTRSEIELRRYLQAAKRYTASLIGGAA